MLVADGHGREVETMRSEAAAVRLEREVQAQRRTVFGEAVGLLKRMGRDELLAIVGEMLQAAGFERVAPASDLLGAPACAAELPLGASRLPILVSVRLKGGVVDEEVLEAFRNEIHGRAALGIILTGARVRRETLDRGGVGSPPVAVYDVDALGECLEQAHLLLAPASPALPLRLEAPKRASAPQPKKRPAEDGRGRAPRLFRWVVEPGEGKHFSLLAEYLPDPTLSFRVPGELLTPEQDFVPARTRLHQAICAELRRIFPDLAPSVIRTKAWPGVHKVYTVDTYGRPAGEK
jgi:hypothetical protein